MLLKAFVFERSGPALESDDQTPGHSSVEAGQAGPVRRRERRGPMKGRISIAVVIALVAVTFLVMGAAGPKHDRDEAVSELRARISLLERRVDNLEKKLQARPAVRDSVRVRPPSPPRGSSRPRGWSPREFNGVPYYIIPLGQKQTPSRRRSALKSR